MKRPLILSLGEVLWDLFPEGERFGGAPCNFACHAAILGAEVAMVSAVGDDQRGTEAMNILRGFGIDVSLLQTIPGVPTGTVGIVLDAAGKPTFTIHEGSAWDRVAWSRDLETRVAEADAVCFGTLGQRGEVSRDTIRGCIQTARAARILRVVDINLRPPFYDDACIRESIELASILKLSDDELPIVCSACGIPAVGSPEPLLRQLLESQNLDLVVMTCGARGAVLATPMEIIHQPGIAVTVRDTVGAGDSFTASFLLSLLRGESPAECLRKACEVAAEVCTQMGAVPNTNTLKPKGGPR